MLTEIVHNETEGYKVFFADGHEESVSRTELQEYMKVPDKYSDLPVKQINKYGSSEILCDDLIVG